MQNFLWNGLLLVAAIVVGALVLWELRVWTSTREHRALRSFHNRRFVRRVGGGVLMLLVLILLRYPAAESLEVQARLFKLLGCLAMLLIVMMLALWDFVVMRRYVKNELQGLMVESTEDLQQHMEDLAKENPKLAQAIEELMATKPQDSESS